MSKHLAPATDLSVIILAAGLGMRLGSSTPKALTRLLDTTIFDYQVHRLCHIVPIDNIIVVVGYKKELLMEHQPDLTYVYNDAYHRTNTGKSLLKALRKARSGDVLWLNGDVVFEDAVVSKIIGEACAKDASCILVDTKKCGDEEVKYKLNGRGEIGLISKQLEDAAGEAPGVNLIVERDVPLLIDHLERIGNDDYFERAVENMITQDGARFIPVATDGLYCEEIDFPEDLVAVERYLKSRAP